MVLFWIIAPNFLAKSVLEAVPIATNMPSNCNFFPSFKVTASTFSLPTISTILLFSILKQSSVSDRFSTNFSSFVKMVTDSAIGNSVFASFMA